MTPFIYEATSSMNFNLVDSFDQNGKSWELRKIEAKLRNVSDPSIHPSWIYNSRFLLSDPFLIGPNYGQATPKLMKHTSGLKVIAAQSRSLQHKYLSSATHTYIWIQMFIIKEIAATKSRSNWNLVIKSLSTTHARIENTCVLCARLVAAVYEFPLTVIL